MKKNLLLVLLPSLFLLTSCGRTTPVSPYIKEPEAIEFINNKYKDVEGVKPTSGKITWKITKDNSDNAAKELIYSYLHTTQGQIKEDDKSKNIPIDDDRLGMYVTELESEQPYDGHFDVVVAMKPKYYEKLRKSRQGGNNAPYSLYYKYANGGLTIVSKLDYQSATFTRTHVYDKNGHETQFKVERSQKDIDQIYTITINFKY